MATAAMALKKQKNTGHLHKANPNTRRAVQQQRAAEQQPLPPIPGGIHERAQLISLTVRKWGITRDEDGQADELAVKNNADPTFLSVRKKLIDKAAISELTTIEGELRQTHHLLTLPWDDSGYRLLTNLAYFQYFDKMNALIERYGAAADKLVDQYDDLKAGARKGQGSLFRDQQWPSKDQLRAKYRVRLHPRPIPLVQDVRVQMGETEVNALRKQIAAEYEDNSRAAQQSVWVRLRSAVEHAVEGLRAYSRDGEGKVAGGFKDSLVKNVEKLLEVLPLLNVAGDPELEGFIAQIREEITSFPGGLLRAHDPTRKQVIDAADDILSKMAGFMA